jgi:hypothetical protein
MRRKNKMVDYGDFNGEITVKRSESLDTKTTTATEALKKVVVKDYSESRIKEGPYVGYVLRVDEAQTPWYSFFKTKWTAKVRVPELDAHIPEPKDFPAPTAAADIQKIEMHLTYLPKSEAMSDVPKPGAKVLVNRDSNGLSGTIIEILEKDGVSPENPSASGGKAAHSGAGGGKGSRGGFKPGRANKKNEDGLTGFRAWNRRSKPTIFVIHETAGNGRKIAEDVMKNKNGGVHYGATDDEIIQWEDPLIGVNHCPNFNGIGIGVEMVHGIDYKNNNYYPARWQCPSNKYTSPPMVQVERLYALVHHVCSTYSIPLVFRQIKKGDLFHMGCGVNKDETTGVVSHISAKGNHGDGNYPCFYMAHRLRGYSPEEAYEIAEEKIARGNPHLFGKVKMSPQKVGGNPAPTLPMNLKKQLPLTFAERKQFPNYP